MKENACLEIAHKSNICVLFLTQSTNFYPLTFARKFLYERTTFTIINFYHFNFLFSFVLVHGIEWKFEQEKSQTRI
jgi:hypothetical protein